MNITPKLKIHGHCVTAETTRDYMQNTSMLTGDGVHGA